MIHDLVELVLPSGIAELECPATVLGPVRTARILDTPSSETNSETTILRIVPPLLG